MNIFDIVNNLVNEQSEIRLQKHIEDPDFAKVWNSFMVLRYVMISDIAPKLFDAQCILQNVTDNKLFYKILLRLCQKAGKSVSPTYRQSPYRR